MSHQYLGIIGQTAPALVVDEWADVEGLNKSEFKLSDHDGEVVVLFFFQSWCPGCHSRGFPTLKKMIDKYKDKKVAFAAIQTVFEGHDANTFATTEKTESEYGLGIPFGHASGESNPRGTPQLMADYKTGGTPWFVVIDQEGKVAYNDFHIEVDELDKYIR